MKKFVVILKNGKRKVSQKTCITYNQAIGIGEDWKVLNSNRGINGCGYTQNTYTILTQTI